MSEQTLPTSVPLLRKLWVVVLLTCLILTFPIAMVVLLTGDVYRWRDHAYHPIGKGARYVYGGLLALWLSAAVLRAAVQNLPVQSPPSGTQASTTPSSSLREKVSEPSHTSAAQPRTNDPQANQTEATLDVDVETEDTRYGPTVTLTAGEPFTLQRLVINGRDHEDNCDLPEKQLSAESTDTSNMGASMQSVYGAQLPKELKTGDKATFFSGCGEVIKFDAYTNRGLFHFRPK